MEILVNKSDLLRGSTIDETLIKRLVEDSKLSESELTELILREDAKIVARDVKLLDFLYFYQFENQVSILNNFIEFLLTDCGGKFPEIDKIPPAFSEHIREVSCVEREEKCSDIKSSIMRKHIQCLKHFHKKGEPLNDGDLFFEAALGGNLEIMKFLKSLKCPWDEYTFSAAAENGNPTNMYWLREESCPWDELTFIEAATHCDMPTLKWLKSEGCPWDEETFYNAAIRGNLEIMKWLRQEKCPWNEEIFTNAVNSRNLENMKWLKKEGCPWNDRTFSAAVLSGNLEIMKWLYENRCPTNNFALYHAIEVGNLENIK